jgi:hypothetical protein
VIYICLPTQNSGIDAYNYAANVKWNHDIFFTHHLFYNLLPYFFLRFFNLINYQIDVLGLMKMINAVFAALSLLVLSRILIIQNKVTKNHFALILIAGSCFGFMRYATENETYIIPVFWSLLATLYFLKYLKSDSKTSIFLSGIFASASCLFHQIHILWYAGLLISILFYKKEIKIALIIAAPAILLPLVYYLAFKQVHFEFVKAQNLWQFVFYDYYYGTAHVQFGIDNFILGFIGFIRSFVQVHGIIPFLFKKSFYYLIVIVPILFFGFQTITMFWKNRTERVKPTIFEKTLIIVFIFQLSFSIFSAGNAEFMVMLPMLLLLIINGLYHLKTIIYLNMGMAILIWNLAFGIFPNHLYNFQNQEKMIEFIGKKNDAMFILSEDVLVQNMLYYKTGVVWNSNIYKSPASLKQQNKTQNYLKEKMDSCLSNNIPVITDCIDEPKVMSRKQYLDDNDNEKFFKEDKKLRTDSIETLFGTRYISLISR